MAERKKRRVPYDKAHGRDYKSDYEKFQKSAKRKKYRAELNKYNRDHGAKKGDKTDASHKQGKIVGYEPQSVNRARAEASRLKGSRRRKRKQ